MPADCHVYDRYGPVSYKYSPGNVFPTDANHPHGLRLVANPAGCCALCRKYKNCTFWTYSGGGTPAQPTCYNFTGACCFLKTDVAKGQEKPDRAGVVSGSTKDSYPPLPTGPLTVTVDWDAAIVTTRTAATVEVDVMPFLGEADWGGPFDGYKKALDDLGSEFVRFAPWFANPRVAVTELTPHVCTATQPSANWNSTYFDAVMKDFMEASELFIKIRSISLFIFPREALCQIVPSGFGIPKLSDVWPFLSGFRPSVTGRLRARCCQGYVHPLCRAAAVNYARVHVRWRRCQTAPRLSLEHNRPVRCVQIRQRSRGSNVQTNGSVFRQACWLVRTFRSIFSSFCCSGALPDRAIAPWEAI
jgi:hypothetical protein